MVDRVPAVCQHCKDNVLESSKVWDYYDVDLNTPEAPGCVFCTRLAPLIQKARTRCSHGIERYGGKAAYRWNIRKAQIRETSSHFSITFRPVSSSCHECEKRNTGELPEVMFYFFPEDDVGYIPPDDKALGSHTGSEQSFGQMKSWLENCENNHPNCKSRHTSSDFMPTRVLDLNTASETCSPTRIRVVETKNVNNERYMTLSHCWGGDGFVRLTQDTLTEFTTKGIPWTTGSPTSVSPNDMSTNHNFVEAIEVARRLGVRYMWIDSLCIIQGEDGDFKTEGGLMHKIYRNSYCNLAAAASKDSKGGLFRKRNMAILPTSYHSLRGSSSRFNGSAWRILPSDLWDSELLGSPLYNRGWVFQERMLSPRLLQFGHNQIFWDCATTSACEALPAGLPLFLDAKAGTDRGWRQRLQEADITVPSRIRTTESSLEKFWEGAVRNYTSCKLTKHDDKQRALWGIAKLVRDMLREDYAFGLWENCLWEQLAWRVAGPPALKPAVTEREAFPSWSWTRLDVPIKVVPRLRGDKRFYVVMDHKQEDISFQLRSTIFRGTVEEEPSLDRNEKFGEVEWQEATTIQRTTETGTMNVTPNPDEPSEPLSPEIEMQSHICEGVLQSNEQQDVWSVVIEGVGKHAVIEAYPDIRPDAKAAPCRFLVLVASRILFSELGDKIHDSGEVKESDAGEIGEIHYSGVGILVEWEDEKEKRMKRIGSVAFRHLNRQDWGHFRRACGEDDEAMQFELDEMNGQKVWLV
ncbi:heterokaryon incompatibility protein [Colletotrichum musicola]|uniref:Heterokaryon incompatibility protein n=1 Tax=Colletotrichum musicola TaxID=2175873 RepID=A0A8H6NRP8_9PEZI|nr:heterokaryon incompatibility protein [Colletotrichum musicola]